MAEFIQLNTQAGGENVATDSIGAVHYQAVKLMLGADGATDGLLDSGQQTMADSVPVAFASNQSEIPIILSIGSAMIGSTTALQGGLWSNSATILNSANWVVSIANTAGWVANVSSTVLNSAGWTVNASSTILNSGGWVVNVGNTAGITVSASSTIINSANWIVKVANTGGAVNVINTAGWTVSASSTILNSGGWVVSVANTGGDVSIANSAGWMVNVSSTILNSAGWIVEVANTGGTVAVSNTGGDIKVISFVDGKTYKTGTFNATTTAVTNIAPLATGSGLNVISLFLSAAAPNTIRFTDGGTGNDLTGNIFVAASGGFVLPAPANPVAPWFKTTATTYLGLSMAAATSVGGVITYYEE